MATPPSLSDAVFTFNDEVVTYADVVLLAMVTGEWPAFAARCAMHAGIPPAFDQSAGTSTGKRSSLSARGKRMRPLDA
jgi:hypothetical protein